MLGPGSGPGGGEMGEAPDRDRGPRVGAGQGRAGQGRAGGDTPRPAQRPDRTSHPSRRSPPATRPGAPATGTVRAPRGRMPRVGPQPRRADRPHQRPRDRRQGRHPARRADDRRGRPSPGPIAARRRRRGDHAPGRVVPHRHRQQPATAGDRLGLAPGPVQAGPRPRGRRRRPGRPTLVRDGMEHGPTHRRRIDRDPAGHRRPATMPRRGTQPMCRTRPIVAPPGSARAGLGESSGMAAGATRISARDGAPGWRGRRPRGRGAEAEGGPDGRAAGDAAVNRSRAPRWVFSRAFEYPLEFKRSGPIIRGLTMIRSRVASDPGRLDFRRWVGPRRGLRGSGVSRPDPSPRADSRGWGRLPPCPRPDGAIMAWGPPGPRR